MGHEVDDDCTLRLCNRWWGYLPDEKTLEWASPLDLRKLHHYMRRVGVRVKEAVAVVVFLAYEKPSGETRGFQVSKRGGFLAKDTCLVGGRMAAVGTIAAVRRPDDPPYGHSVGPSRSGIVDVPGGRCM